MNAYDTYLKNLMAWAGPMSDRFIKALKTHPDIKKSLGKRIEVSKTMREGSLDLLCTISISNDVLARELRVVFGSHWARRGSVPDIEITFSSKLTTNLLGKGRFIVHQKSIDPLKKQLVYIPAEPFLDEKLETMVKFLINGPE